jgi:hypothetical protein
MSFSFSEKQRLYKKELSDELVAFPDFVNRKRSGSEKVSDESVPTRRTMKERQAKERRQLP